MTTTVVISIPHIHGENKVEVVAVDSDNETVVRTLETEGVVTVAVWDTRHIEVREVPK